jgi:hypothetical protein
MPGREGLLRLPRPVRRGTHELAVSALLHRRRLAAPVLQQFGERLPHRGIGVVSEHHAPSGLGQVLPAWGEVTPDRATATTKSIRAARLVLYR